MLNVAQYAPIIGGSIASIALGLTRSELCLPVTPATSTTKPGGLLAHQRVVPSKYRLKEKIIATLAANSRLSSDRLAATLGVSPSEIARAIRPMLRSKDVIRVGRRLVCFQLHQLPASADNEVKAASSGHDFGNTRAA